MDLEEITNGSMNGVCVWICDYRFNDISEKPIRHVKPQRVLVRSNEETKKRIYYSESHFVGLNKDGNPLKSKIIPVFDNTGHRSFPGIPVNVFDTESECYNHYVSQCVKVEKMLDEWKVEVDRRYKEMSEKVVEDRFKYFRV